MAGKQHFKKGSSPGAAPPGYTTAYFDANGAMHLVQSDGTDITISAQTLAALIDVAISSPTNGQLLRYNSTLGKWENFTPTSAAQKTAADRLFLYANFT